MEENKPKKSNNSKNILIVLLLLLLLGTTGFFGYQYFNNLNNSNNELTEYEQNINAITKIDKEERQKQVDQLVKDGEINIQYDIGATFKGKVSEQFNVKNIENNKGDIQFVLYDENGETIYTSKKIKRGYEVNKIKLDKSLSKGTHKCRISIGYVNRGNVSSTFPINITVK